MPRRERRNLDMALKLNDRYLNSFVAEHELTGIAPAVKAAHDQLVNRNGLGSDFLGWIDLPVDYDKEEFARIKQAAAKIKKDSDVLIVIGIGGSYLGARAVIEAIKSSLYNSLKKDTPDIYFIGNSISPTYLSEVVSLVEGKDFSVNIIPSPAPPPNLRWHSAYSATCWLKSTAKTAQRDVSTLPPIRQRELSRSSPTRRATRPS